MKALLVRARGDSRLVTNPGFCAVTLPQRLLAVISDSNMLGARYRACSTIVLHSKAVLG